MSEDNNRQKSNEGESVYAYIPFSSALEVAEAIYRKCGGTAKKFQTLEEATGVKGGSLRERIANARKYNLIDGWGELKPTALAMRIIKPIDDKEGGIATRESILAIPLFKQLFERYKGQLPPEEVFFANILEREYDIPRKIIGRVSNAVRKNFELISGLSLPEMEVSSNMNAETVESSRIETKFNRIPIKKSDFLIINFGEHSHEFKISSDIDWEIAEAVLDGLKKKWVKTKNEIEGKS